jgi:hypothetical protein
VKTLTRLFSDKRIFWVLLAGVFAVSLAVRLNKLTTPLADWHSWRQADTVSVTREYVKHNYPILYPHYMDLSDIPSGLNNVDGYRMVEFPIINYGIAMLLRQFPTLSIVVTSRLVSIGFSMISLLGLYALVVAMTQRKFLAALTAAVFGLLPFSVYYSRTALPEPAFVCFQVLSVLFFFLWVEAVKKKGIWWRRVVWALLTIASFALALLMKPMAIFVAPVLGVMAVYELGLAALWQFEFWVLLLAFAPLAAWRKWILQFPSGIPASSWLFNGNGIRLRPAWWRWLFEDRLGRLIMGYWGLVFLTLGLMVKEGKKHLSLFDVVTLTWAASMMAYLVVIATGNVQHDYYQVTMTPAIALVFARGLWAVPQLAKKIGSPWVVYPVAAFVLALSAFFSWYEVSGYYNINNPAIIHAGQEIDATTPPDVKVIAPYSGDTAFLFQTNRTGWPIGGRIEEKIKMGASYYVTTAEDDEAKQLEKKYPVLEKTPEFIILKLTP